MEVRRQGWCAVAVPTSVTIRLGEQTATVEASCPPQLFAQAQGKAAPLLKLVQTCVAERDAESERPTTAYDRRAQRSGS